MTRHYLWNDAAELLTKPLAAALMDLRREDGDNDLLMDAVSMAEILEDTEVVALDGVVAQYQKIARIAGQMERVMSRAAGDVKPVAHQVSDPFMQLAVLQVAVIYELSDGQTVTVLFHNPDTTPKKIRATDELVSWKWMLNKKDVTILVAPEQGRELNVREVARRIMNAAGKNSAAFVRNNAKRAERLGAIEALKTEIVVLEEEITDLEGRIAAWVAPVEPELPVIPAGLTVTSKGRYRDENDFEVYVRETNKTCRVTLFDDGRSRVSFAKDAGITDAVAVAAARAYAKLQGYVIGDVVPVEPEVVEPEPTPEPEPAPAGKAIKLGDWQVSMFETDVEGDAAEEGDDNLKTLARHWDAERKQLRYPTTYADAIAMWEAVTQIVNDYDDLIQEDPKGDAVKFNRNIVKGGTGLADRLMKIAKTLKDAESTPEPELPPNVKNKLDSHLGIFRSAAEGLANARQTDKAMNGGGRYAGEYWATSVDEAALTAAREKLAALLAGVPSEPNRAVAQAYVDANMPDLTLTQQEREWAGMEPEPADERAALRSRFVALSKQADGASWGIGNPDYYGVIQDDYGELSDTFMPERDNKQMAMAMGDLAAQHGRAIAVQINVNKDKPFRVIKVLHADGRGIGSQWAETAEAAYEMVRLGNEPEAVEPNPADVKNKQYDEFNARAGEIVDALKADGMAYIQGRNLWSDGYATLSIAQTTRDLGLDPALTFTVKAPHIETFQSIHDDLGRPVSETLQAIRDAVRAPDEAVEPEPAIAPETLAQVDAAYRFADASDEFKAWVAESIEETAYSPFATAKAMDIRAKANGATIEWGLFAGAALDSMFVVDDDEDGDLFDDAHWKKQPREKRTGRWRLRRAKAMKRAAGNAVRKAAGAVSNAASKAGDYVKRALKGDDDKDDGKALKGGGAGAGDVLEGAAKADAGAAAINEIVGGVKAVKRVFDSATLDGIDQEGYVGKIRKDGKIVGRIDMGDDGKAMVFVGASGDVRVSMPGKPEIPIYYTDEDAPDMVDWLFGVGVEVVIEPTPDPATLAPEGAENIVKTAKGREVVTGFAVVEAADLIVSHDANGDPNPDYPAELQPRDRSRTSSIAWVRKTASQLDPDSLGRTRRADTGAPIVGTDRVVESGNGRTMAIQEAYRSGKAEEYRAWLIEEAPLYKLSPARIKAMKAPVLVRVRTSDLDRREFAVEANQDDKLSMTGTEKARADADRLDDALLSKLGNDGDLLSAANRDFIRGFLASLGDTEAAQYLTTDGQPTGALIARVQAAVFAKAYNDDRLLELTADASKPEVANVVNALNASAAEFIRAQAADKAGTDALSTQIADSVDVSMNQQVIQTLIDATNLVRKAKADGQDVSEAMSQMGLFESIPPATAAMAIFIAKNNRSSKRLGVAFTAMARHVRREAERGQTVDMFGDSSKATLEQIIAAANLELDREYGEGQFAIETIDMFAVTPTPEPQPEPTPEVVPAPEPTTAPTEYRYAAINRPPGYGTAPDGILRIDPQPPKGADHHDQARHGIVVYARKLTDQEASSYELIPIIEGAALDALVEETAAKFADRADDYIAAQQDFPADEFIEVLRSSVEQAVKGTARYAPSVGNWDAFTMRVFEAMKAKYGGAVVTPEPEPVIPTDNDLTRVNALKRAAPKGAVPSDDPDAIEKLAAKLEYLTAYGNMMTKTNKLLRKNDIDGLHAMGYTDGTIAKLKEPDFAGRTGFPDYEMTNNSSEKRRIKKRLDELSTSRFEREEVEPAVVPDPTPTPNPDRALFQAVIAGTVPNMLSPELADDLIAAYERAQGDPELTALAEQAMDEYERVTLATEVV